MDAALAGGVWHNGPMMDFSFQSLVQALAYLAMAVGLVGTFAPLLPGAVLIWAGALAWAWVDGFERVGWPTLVVLAVLVAASMAADVALTAFGAAKGGASWQGMLAAALAAIVGFILFNFLGALLGCLLGLLVWETYRRGGDWRQAWKSSGGAILGYVASSAVRFAIGVVMLVIFAWQAFGAS